MLHLINIKCISYLTKHHYFSTKLVTCSCDGTRTPPPITGCVRMGGHPMISFIYLLDMLCTIET
ncbi:hypothetical protein HanXRQr2_Chr05g0237031 [Helianthus annuus]|uniref:Uncharacterized protein n=1 Tax=Helianthus annuus TaxID=4232 RepID=A0A9K3NQ15_HELAN|nr:hypothetical protein HanXRQr2_Chr05g0237031 [Helianthus annuus]